MKLAKILCERAGPAPGEARGEAHAPCAPSWLCLLSPRKKSGAGLELQMRPHSTPVRSTGTDLSGRKPHEMGDDGPRAAFYSLRPPAQPMRLVAVALHEPRALPACPPLPAPPDPAPALAPALAPPPRPTFVYDEERCKNAVRSVLCELLAALPVRACGSPARRSLSPRLACSPRRLHRAPHARAARASVLPPSSPPAFYVDGHKRNLSLVNSTARSEGSARQTEDTRSADVSLTTGASSAECARCIPRRHIARHAATQAHTNGSVPRDDCQHPPDQWLGGMRALRDSHVRLVRSQLRHIERLNRALEGTARSRQPSPHNTHTR